MQNISILFPEEVHICSAYIEENSDIHYFLSILSEAELQRINSFKFIKDKNAFIVSRGILRCLLGRYLKEKPQDIKILYGPWRKPYLSPKNAIYFNLSHSKGYALYAFTLHTEVGIDLQYIDSTVDVENIALTILSTKEQAYWKKVPQENKISTFFKFWVFKEALLKTAGKGCLDNRHEIPLTALKSLCKTPTITSKMEKVTFPYYFEVIPGYASAVNMERGEAYFLYFTW